MVVSFNENKLSNRKKLNVAAVFHHEKVKCQVLQFAYVRVLWLIQAYILQTSLKNLSQGQAFLGFV